MTTAFTCVWQGLTRTSYEEAVEMVQQHQQLTGQIEPKRSNRKIKWHQQEHRLGEHDGVFIWHKPPCPDWMSESEYQSQPERLLVRVFKVGKYTYVTTFLDANCYQKKALAKLYRQRWQIELDLRNLKQTMKLAFLPYQTPEMVRKALIAALIAHNWVRLLMLKAALKANCGVRDLSFKNALILLRNRLLVPFIGLSAAHLLVDFVVQHRVGQRPNRQEPRALKYRNRRTNKYPYLDKPRSKVKTELLQQQAEWLSEFRALQEDACFMPA